MSNTEYCLEQLYDNRGGVIFSFIVLCFILSPQCDDTARKALVWKADCGLKIKLSYLQMFEWIMVYG